MKPIETSARTPVAVVRATLRRGAEGLVSSIGLLGVAFAAVVTSAGLDAALHGLGEPASARAGAPDFVQPSVIAFAHAAPLPPLAAEPGSREAPAATAIDLGELGLRVRPATEGELAALASLGVGAAVRVTNVVAGGERGFQRGDFIVGDCEGAGLVQLAEPVSLAATGEAPCLRIVRDGAFAVA